MWSVITIQSRRQFLGLFHALEGAFPGTVVMWFERGLAHTLLQCIVGEERFDAW